MTEERRLPVYPTIQFLETLQDAVASTLGIIELQPFAQTAINIVRAIAGKRDSDIHRLADMACTLVYVVLDIANAHGELSIGMINDIGGITKVLAIIEDMVTSHSLPQFSKAGRERKIKDCEQTFKIFISQHGIMDAFTSKLGVISDATKNGTFVGRFLEAPRGFLRPKGAIVTTICVTAGGGPNGHAL